MTGTVLVTGGAGFIGSHFVRLFCRHNPSVHVVVLDALTYAGNQINLADVSPDSFTFIHGSICDRACVSRLFDYHPIKQVVHFAAESHVDRSIEDASLFVETNVLGTHVLLDVARAHDIDRFIHVSTDEVYGSLGVTGAFKESDPLQPNSPYAASKASSDLLVRSFVQTYDFPAIITRCSNNYGPNQFPEKLIPVVIQAALSDQPIPVYGDGSNRRDWLHVYDHCSAILTILNDGQLGAVYNIDGGTELSNLELVKQILAVLDKPDSLITFVDDRLGHDFRYAMDDTFLRTQLNWAPSISFEKGLEETVLWYKTNS